MPIIRKNGKELLFIHIPKCGGTSIEEACREDFDISLLHSFPGDLPCPPQHFHADLLENLFDFKVPPSVCIVRHPFARLVSEFRYLASHQIVDGTDFEKFVNNGIGEYWHNPYVHNNHIRPQTHFICQDTEIFRLEESGVTATLKYINSFFGTNRKNNKNVHANVSREFDFPVTDSTLELINSFYARDMEAFGYLPISIDSKLKPVSEIAVSPPSKRAPQDSAFLRQRTIEDQRQIQQQQQNHLEQKALASEKRAEAAETLSAELHRDLLDSTTQAKQLSQQIFDSLQDRHQQSQHMLDGLADKLDASEAQVTQQIDTTLTREISDLRSSVISEFERLLDGDGSRQSEIYERIQALTATTQDESRKLQASFSERLERSNEKFERQIESTLAPHLADLRSAMVSEIISLLQLDQDRRNDITSKIEELTADARSESQQTRSALSSKLDQTGEIVQQRLDQVLLPELADMKAAMISEIVALLTLDHNQRIDIAAQIQEIANVSHTDSQALEEKISSNLEKSTSTIQERLNQVLLPELAEMKSAMISEVVALLTLDQNQRTDIAAQIQGIADVSRTDSQALEEKISSKLEKSTSTIQQRIDDSLIPQFTNLQTATADQVEHLLSKEREFQAELGKKLDTLSARTNDSTQHIGDRFEALINSLEGRSLDALAEIRKDLTQLGEQQGRLEAFSATMPSSVDHLNESRLRALIADVVGKHFADSVSISEQSFDGVAKAQEATSDHIRRLERKIADIAASTPRLNLQEVDEALASGLDKSQAETMRLIETFTRTSQEELVRLRSEVQARREHDEQLFSDLTQTNKALEHANANVAHLNNELQGTLERFAEEISYRESLHAKNSFLEAQLRHLQQQNHLMLNSRSLRLTQPLRSAANAIRRVLGRSANSSGISNALTPSGPEHSPDSGIVTATPADHQSGQFADLSIAIVVENLDRGGLEQVVLDHACYFDRECQRLDLIVANETGHVYEQAVSLGLNVIRAMDDAVAIQEYIDTKNYDYAFFHHSYGLLPHFRAVTKQMVEVIHNEYSWQLNNEFYETIRPDCIDQYIAVSDPVRDYSLEHLAIPPDQIITINNGLNKEGLLRPPPRILQTARLESVSKNPIFIMCANGFPQKNHLLVIRAFKKLLKNLPTAKLWLAGNLFVDDKVGRAIRQELQASGDQDSIVALGSLNRRDLSTKLARAHVALLPTKYEGFSIATLEYLYFGLPMILSNTGGAQHIKSVYDCALVNQDIVRTDAAPSNKEIASLCREMQQIIRNYPSWLQKATDAAYRHQEYDVDATCLAYLAKQ